MTAPCGVPIVAGMRTPFSNTPTVSHLRIRRRPPHGSRPWAEGPRPAGNRVTRLDPIVKLTQIQTFDKRPNQPRPVVVRQLTVQIDHIPAQLSSVWTNDPHPLAHSIPRTPLIAFYYSGGTSSSYGPNFSGLDYTLLRRDGEKR